jgi:hypothetical protein
MILLSDLVSRLMEDCPADAGVPSETQYERAVKNAIIDFGERAGRTKRATLQIVADTASYELPDDFLKIVKMSSLMSEGDIINSAQGLIPVTPGYCEEYLINGLTITFYPTPAYSLAREYRYKAGWALSVDSLSGEVYDDLTEREAKIIMLLAQSLAKQKIENALGGGFSYRQGDVTVDTTGEANSLKASAERLKADYLAAVDAYNGTVLVMG